MRGRDPFDPAQAAARAWESAASAYQTATRVADSFTDGPSPELVWDALSVALGVDARELAGETVTALRCPACRMVREGVYACSPEHGAAILAGVVLRAARRR